MNAVYLGIDIGIGGAVAVLTADGQLIAVHDMPVLPSGPGGRNAVSGTLLANLIRPTNAAHAFVELVGSRPGEAASSAFSFGHARGSVEATLGALGTPYTLIAPATWKRATGVSPGKEAKDTARAKAAALWPAMATSFARKSDLDRAEAALIALAGLNRRNAA